METPLGEQLRVLQGKLKATAIARRALPRATEEEVAHFANYFSRITHGRVKSVGYDYLRLIAAGFGFVRLSEFFRHLEMGLPMEEIKAQDLRSSHGGDSDDQPSQSEDQRRTINLLAKGLLDAQERLTAFIQTTRDTTRKEDLREAHHPRAETPQRPRPHGGRDRQSARRSAKRRPGK